MATELQWKIEGLVEAAYTAGYEQAMADGRGEDRYIQQPATDPEWTRLASHIADHSRDHTRRTTGRDDF